LDNRSFYRDAVFFLIARMHARRVLVFFRGWDPRFELSVRTKLLPKTLFSASFARSRYFVVLGTTFKNKLLELHCRPDAHYWIETTVADSSGLDRFAIASRMGRLKTLRVLFLARLTRTKGSWEALKAFELAQTSRPDLSLELTLAGPGPELHGLRAQVAADGVRNVSLPGPVRGEAKTALLLNSHVLLHPTYSDEGMPNTILEAMLYGMPILTTATGAIPEVIMHGVNGFVSNTPAPEQFAGWIIELATNDALRERMARANHELAMQRYVDSCVRTRVKAIIDQCLKDDGSPARDGSIVGSQSQ
jgi:glycosyltransferase involved in cell wall biosynthesis